MNGIEIFTSKQNCPSRSVSELCPVGRRKRGIGIHLPQDGSRQHRKAADARKHKHTGNLCLRVELGHAEYKIGCIGEIKVIDAGSNAGGDDAIAINSIILEWSGRIDDQIRSLCLHACNDVGAIQFDRANPRPPFVVAAKRFGSGEIATADEEFYRRNVG